MLITTMVKKTGSEVINQAHRDKGADYKSPLMAFVNAMMTRTAMVVMVIITVI